LKGTIKDGFKMTNREDIFTFLKNNKNYLHDRFHVKRIGVFGSFARGNYNDNSDIDIIVELDENTINIHEIKNELRDYLKENLERDVDIAREKYLKSRIKEEILEETIYV